MKLVKGHAKALNKGRKTMKKHFKHIFAFVLIAGFAMLTLGCESSPEFWAALSDSLTGGSSSSSSSSSSNSSSSSSSYTHTLYNKSSVTVTVYGDGRTIVIPPGSYRSLSGLSSQYIDWEYEPYYLEAYTSYGSVTFYD
jgi:hypothetical protein